MSSVLFLEFIEAIGFSAVAGVLLLLTSLLPGVPSFLSIHAVA